MHARGAGLAVVVASAVAGGGCFLRRPEVPHASIVAYPVRELELANGLRVVLETAPDFGVGGAVLVLGAGAGDEPVAQAGLAHLTEHVVFEAVHGGVSLGQRERELGWHANARTSWDDTTLYVFEDTRALEDAVTFLAGAVADPLAGVGEAVFARELRAVGNEMRMRTEEGTPGQALGWLMTAAFPREHPYGHSIGGTPETLAGLRLEDVRAFVSGHYRPETSTLVVSAPLSLDAAQAMVERITGQRAHPPASPWRRRQHGAPPTARARSFETREAAVATPTLWMGWSVPPANGEDGDLGLLVTSLLDNARFALEERDRDIAGISAGVLRGTAASLLWVEVALKDAEHPERTAGMIADEMSQGVAEFEAQKRFTATRYVYLEEGLAARTLNLAWSAQHLGNPTFLRGLDERMAHRSQSAVLDYAQSFLGRERAHVLLLRPTSAPPAPDGLGPAPLSPAPSAPAPAAPPAPAVRRLDEAPPSLARLETHQLANGLTLILVPSSGSPFHTVLLGFRGGHAEATPPGVPVAASWGRRWEQWSPTVFGIDYRNLVRADSTLEVLRSTGSDVGVTLGHLARLLGFTTFWPPQQFTRKLAVFEREEQAPPELFERALSRATFGAHPLGVTPTAREIQRITPSEVLRWIDRVRRPRNAAVVIVGDFDPRQALAAAEAGLGSWGASATPSQPLEPLSPLDRAPEAGGRDDRVLMHNRPGAQQATVRIRCLLPPVTPDHLAAPRIFSEAVQRVLRRSLREELGASYSVSTNLHVFIGGTAVFDVAADVSYDQLVPALHEIRRLLGQGGRAVVEPAIFESARGLVARPLRYDTRNLAEVVFDAWNLGWPLDTLDRLPAQARGTSLDEVAAIADHCAENAVVGVMGDARLMRRADLLSAGP